MKTSTRPLYILSLLCLVLYTACHTTKPTLENDPEIANDISADEKKLFDAKEGGEEVRIANDSVEYEIIIIDPGFNVWVNSIARPRGYYDQTFLENRNQLFVTEYNARVIQPNRFSPNLYEWQINYDRFTDYGYEVNYLLYNYFIYFQRKYNQRLSGFIPRI
jgi:hypothetical protein